MKKIIWLLLIPCVLFAQFGRSQLLWKGSADSVFIGYGITKFKIGSNLYLGNSGFRFFGGQLQFSNDLVSWHQIPISLSTSAGWTSGLNKIYQSTIGDKFYWRMTASDTTATTHDFYVGGTARFTRPVQFDSGFVLPNNSPLNKGGYAFDGNQYITFNVNDVVSSIQLLIIPDRYNCPLLTLGTDYSVTINSAYQLVFDSGFSNLKCYINDKETNQLVSFKPNLITITFDSVNVSTCILGDDGNTGANFVGEILLFRLFNNVLTYSEHITTYTNNYEIPYYLQGASNQNIVQNGTFDDNSYWILGSGVSISNGVCNIVSTGPPVWIRKAGVTLPYKKYRIEYDINLISGDFLFLNSTFISTYSTQGTAHLVHEWISNMGASTHNILFGFTTSGQASIDNVYLKRLGCIAEYRPENAGAMGWIDASGNGYHGITYGTLIVFANRKDYKAGISTTTVQMVNSQKAFTILEKVIVKNNYAGTNTFYLGTSTSANELLNGVSINSGETKAFDVNSYSATTRSLYVKAGNSNVDVIFVYKPIGE